MVVNCYVDATPICRRVSAISVTPRSSEVAKADAALPDDRERPQRLKNSNTSHNCINGNNFFESNILCTRAHKNQDMPPKNERKLQQKIQHNIHSEKPCIQNSNSHHKLFDMILQHSYDKALAYVKKHPHSSYARHGPQNQTPLHLLCSDPPSSIATGLTSSIECGLKTNESLRPFFQLIETLIANSGKRKAIFIPNQRGHTPLNLALYLPSQDVIVESLLRPYRKHCMAPCFTKKERNTSLHVAVSMGCSVQTITNIAQTFPTMVVMGDRRTGNTPLHLAVLGSLDAVKSEIVTFYEENKNNSNADYYKRKREMHATGRDSCYNNLSEMPSKDNGNVSAPDDAMMGKICKSPTNYPHKNSNCYDASLASIPFAGAHKTPCSVNDHVHACQPLLLLAQAAALLSQKPSNDTATLSPHRNNFNACEVIEALLKVNPDAARVSNKNSQLPLHFICYVSPGICNSSPLNHSSLPSPLFSCWTRLKTTIQVIVKAYPEGLVQKDSRGYTPIDYIILHVEQGKTETTTKIAREILEYMYEAAAGNDAIYRE